jgi:hypothetical protein
MQNNYWATCIPACGIIINIKISSWWGKYPPRSSPRRRAVFRYPLLGAAGDPGVARFIHPLGAPANNSCEEKSLF